MIGNFRRFFAVLAIEVLAIAALGAAPLEAHVPQDVGIEHAIEMGQATVDHLDGYIEFLDGANGPLDEASSRPCTRAACGS